MTAFVVIGSVLRATMSFWSPGGRRHSRRNVEPVVEVPTTLVGENDEEAGPSGMLENVEEGFDRVDEAIEMEEPAAGMENGMEFAEAVEQAAQECRVPEPPIHQVGPALQRAQAAQWGMRAVRRSVSKIPASKPSRKPSGSTGTAGGMKNGGGEKRNQATKILLARRASCWARIQFFEKSLRRLGHLVSFGKLGYFRYNARLPLPQYVKACEFATELMAGEGGGDPAPPAPSGSELRLNGERVMSFKKLTPTTLVDDEIESAVQAAEKMKRDREINEALQRLEQVVATLRGHGLNATANDLSGVGVRVAKQFY